MKQHDTALTLCYQDIVLHQHAKLTVLLPGAFQSMSTVIVTCSSLCQAALCLYWVVMNAGDTDDGIVTRSVMYLYEQMQRNAPGCRYTFRQATHSVQSPLLGGREDWTCAHGSSLCQPLQPSTALLILVPALTDPENDVCYPSAAGMLNICASWVTSMYTLPLLQMSPLDDCLYVSVSLTCYAAGAQQGCCCAGRHIVRSTTKLCMTS